MKKTITALIIGLVCVTNTTLVNAEDLLSVYQQAQKNDPTVLRSKALFNASKEGIDQARAVLLPEISAAASYTQSEGEFIPTSDDGQSSNRLLTNKSDTLRYGLSLSMPLYNHSTWLRLDNAKKAAHRSDVSYQAAKQELIVRVTSAYFDVLSAKDDLDFAKAEKAAIERQLEQTKQRYSVGLKAVTDVHEAQSQYDNAVTSEIRAENSVFTAEEALRVITNVYPRNLSVLNTERFSTSRPIPDSANEWQQTAEAKNLDLISQKIAVDVAKENINIARSGHYPTLSLSGSYGSSDQDNEVNNITFKNPALDSQSIGITLNVPIYSGGATSSAVRQAQSNYVAASQDLELTYRNVVRNTRNAYNTVIAAVSAIKALEQSVVSADSALKATEAGFEVGTRTIVDVLDSTRNLYNAKRNLSSTRYNYVQSILSLKRAAGTISEQDLININQGLSDVK
ncbi:outer membrane channel protein TolC [Colwellia hornerae]|uniref:Outer membrane channel protein TolC n=1 Tax=Colwellia hornerae TaxID=89402 RepID=A0A5C6QD38_9GAMM|nr:outer membrane channel protein TolC [Colwellia hornerae]TWX51653.1 outer membrane channel protein TolC [Colwellia hornerae]TWX57441.1 outer membrane channel protein TolC [Colwellia hornerae]TWX66944.1 outer membrane channel protein TolC [Colwellia hornerae]